MPYDPNLKPKGPQAPGTVSANSVYSPTGESDTPADPVPQTPVPPPGTPPPPAAPPPSTPTPPGAPPTPPGGTTHYNTTPNWKDPNSAPSPGDQYWGEWITANPTYRGQGYTGAETPEQWQWIAEQYFKNFAINGSIPSSKVLDYIIAAIPGSRRATHAGNLPSDDKIILPNGQIVDLIRDTGGPNAAWMWSVDTGNGGSSGHQGNYSYQDGLNYITAKLGRPLTQAEINAVFQHFGGTPNDTFPQANLDQVVAWIHNGGAGGGGGTGGFQPIDPNLSGSYQDAINVISQRWQEYFGRPITEADINALKAHFGWQPDTAASGGGLSTSTKVDPNGSFSGNDALAYLNRESTRLRGTNLSQDEINYAINAIHYVEGQPITGAQLNQLLGQLDSLATAHDPSNPGSNHTYTGVEINQVLQYMFNQAHSGGGSGGGPGGPSGPAGPNGPSGGPGGGPGGTQSPYMSQLIAQLMARAGQSLNIDPSTDPIIAPQLNAANAAGVRQGRNFLNDMAESSNPFATGAMNTARTQVAEDASQKASALSAQLVQNELTARRQEIQAALTEEGSLLTSQQQLALQQQLAMIDAALRQQSVSNQNTQFYSGMNQNDRQFLQSLLYQYNQLGSSNDQFAARYNLDLTQLANYWDALRNGTLG